MNRVLPCIKDVLMDFAAFQSTRRRRMSRVAMTFSGEPPGPAALAEKNQRMPINH